MTDIEKKRLSLAGRLRMASVVRGPDTSLMSEAADTIEQHEAFRREVSDAVKACGISVCHPLHKFVIAKPVDPLVEAWIEATGNTVGMEPLNAALAARGLKIVKVGE